VLRLARGHAVHLAWPLAVGALWAGTDAAALVAPGLPLAAAATLAPMSARDRAHAKGLLRYAAIAMAGLLFGPYGTHLIGTLLVHTARVAGGGTPIDLSRPEVLALVAVAGSLGALSLRTNLRASEGALLLFVLALGLTDARALPWLVATEVAVLGRTFDGLAPHRRWGRRPHVAIGAALATACLAPSGVALGIARPPASAFAARAEGTTFPDDAARVLAGRPPEEHVFHPPSWGGYLAWAWDGKRRTFADERDQLFDAGVMSDARAILAAGPDWAQLLEAYRVADVVAPPGSPLDRALSAAPDWMRLSESAVAVVHGRRTPLR
jgi:hypothetical protein